MEYTINKISKISGVSTRTLRYYDEIDLLKPARVNSSGYRIYGKNEIDKLQQILFYKRLGLSLGQIKLSLEDESFSKEEMLMSHYRELLKERDQINLLLNTVEKTIKYYRGEQEMTDEEKFISLKQQQLADNEAKYGTEIRENYGNDTVNQSNKKYESLTENEIQEMKEVEERLFISLRKLTDIESKEGKEVFKLHKKWLQFSWPTYSAEAHRKLVDMYLLDDRFANYYIKNTNINGVKLLHDAVHYYA